MGIINAIILGIVQGLTEFIPVSSSGHLVIFHQWLGVTQSGLAFDVALHLGTLLALLIFFRNDLIRLIKSVFMGGKDRKLALLLIIATIPAVIVGYLLESSAESTFRSVRLVAINLMVVALIMLLAERYSARQKDKTLLDDVRPKQAIAIGLAQAVAIIPGVSRSGSTIITGLFAGMDRVAATRFSFLLGIPITFGAIVKVFLSDNGLLELSKQPNIFMVGVVSAFISGMFAITFLLKYLAKHTLDVFAYYRIGLAILVLLFSVI
jgi:undecaprenyl-diphosphatase